MIRNKHWKYIHRYYYGPHELYQISVDPEEKRNLINEPKMRERIESMRTNMEGFFQKYAVANMDGSKLPVGGFGQIDSVSSARGGRDAFNKNINFEMKWLYAKRSK